MSEETFNFNYLILIKNHDVIKYVKDSYINETEHQYYINKSTNHFDYYNLLKCKDNSSVLFVECNKLYKIVNGYSGICCYNEQKDCLNYYIIKKFNIDDEELKVLENSSLDIANQFKINNLIINVDKVKKPYNEKSLSEYEFEVRKKLINLAYALYQQRPIAFNEFVNIKKIYYGYEPVNKNTLLSFHAKIGNKNNTFADCVNNQFQSFDSFMKKWEEGLFEQYRKIINSNRTEESKNNIRFLVALFQNNEVQKYIFLFLERNFYRNYKARIRKKPIQQLTELYIGDNTNTFHLLITPVFRSPRPLEEKHWQNDISEIRRTNFTYWTVNHLMNSGFIYNNELKKLDELKDVFIFYKFWWKNSKSPYEKEFICKYTNFLANTTEYKNIPLLIPEFRYGGQEPKHIYRLDFLIINIVEEKIIGIELSPNHHIEGKNASQTIDNWEYEIAKRNCFFDKYSITTITFTSSMLENIDNCWEKVLPYLQPINEFSDQSYYDELMKINLSNVPYRK